MAAGGLFGVAPYSAYIRRDASGWFSIPGLGSAPRPIDPHAAGRGLFGIAPYARAVGRPESSISFRALQPTLQPPRMRFLETPDPRPPAYQARPSRDASTILGSNLQVDIATITVRRFFTTDIPVPPYHPLLAMIRGRASPDLNIPPVGPVLAFLTRTDPLQRSPLRSDERIFAPLFLDYEAGGSGSFFATTVPWRDRHLLNASQMLPAVPPVPLTLTVSQRILANLLSYQSPHRQEGSLLIATPGGTASIMPVQQRRFAMTDWAFRTGPSYPAHDPSRTTSPAHQPGDKIVIPSRTYYIPTWRRRRR